MSQFANLLHSGCQPWSLPGLHLTFPNQLEHTTSSVAPALTDRVSTLERPSKRVRSENAYGSSRSERGPDPLDNSDMTPPQIGTFVHQWGTQSF